MSFKKIVLLASIVASSIVNAGVYAPTCQDGVVPVPCERSAWDFSVDALVLKDYSRSIVEAGGFEGDLKGSLNYNLAWGFRLEGSYHFGTGNDITLNWAHYDNTFKGQLSELRYNDEGPFESSETVNHPARKTSRFNIVNVEFGQHLNIGQRVGVRFHGGLQYASLGKNFTVSNEDNNHLNIKISGLAPRIGLDSNYELMQGFSVFANASVGLLVSNRTIAGFTEFDDASDNIEWNSIFLASDFSLGGSYSKPLAQGLLTARVAWTTYYYSGAEIVRNLGWSGVSFGLKWLGNA